MPALTDKEIRQQSRQRQRCIAACVGYRLKCMRLKLRLSTNQVSVHTGLHKKVIERIETGGQLFTLLTMEPLAHYYKITPSQLLFETDIPPTARDWKTVNRWQQQLKRYLKTKQSAPPNVGVQLEFKF